MPTTCRATPNLSLYLHILPSPLADPLPVSLLRSLLFLLIFAGNFLSSLGLILLTFYELCNLFDITKKLIMANPFSSFREN